MRGDGTRGDGMRGDGMRRRQSLGLLMHVCAAETDPSRALEMPKSPIRTAPLAVKKMLCALRSRCRTRREWT